METFSFYYLCGKAQHGKGGTRLHDLRHTVYHVEYLKANKKSKDLTNESNVKRGKLNTHQMHTKKLLSYHCAIPVNP